MPDQLLMLLVVQVMTPAMTLSVCYVAGLERLTTPLVVSVVAISLGTGMNCLLPLAPCCDACCTTQGTLAGQTMTNSARRSMCWQSGAVNIVWLTHSIIAATPQLDK